MGSVGSGGDDGELATLLRQGSAAGQTSARLLERFAASRDEASFAALVARHGPMVRATCRRLLPDPADADDAFQATFLVLARRAGGIADGDRLAPWLHGVARLVAARCRRGNARRRRREVSNREPGEAAPAVDPPPVDGSELRSILDEELARLPGKYRDPLILCYLDGLTSDEAARQLAWPVGTVRTRLAGGRDRLRSRLARRGYAPDALALLSPATLPSAAVSPTLQATTVRLALGTLAAGTSTAPAAVLLARGVLATMLSTKLMATTLGVAVTAALAVGSAGLIAAQNPASTVSPVTAAPLGTSNLPGPQAPGAEPAQPNLDPQGTTQASPQMTRRDLEKLFGQLTIIRSRIDIDYHKARKAQGRRLQPPDEEGAVRLSEVPLSDETISLLRHDLASAREQLRSIEQALIGPTGSTPTPPTDELATAQLRIKTLEADLAASRQADEPSRALQPAISVTRTEPGEPAQSSPAPRAATIEAFGNYILSTSAERDRVVLFDPTTERRATLRLTKPADQITPQPLHFFPEPKPGQRGEVQNLIGLSLRGPAVSQLAVFDPVSFRWYDQPLGGEVTAAEPLATASDGNRWVTFELNGSRVVEAPAFNINTRAWDVDRLDQPPQSFSLSGITPDGLKITRSGTFYHFRRLEGGPTIRFEVKTPLTPPNGIKLDQPARGEPLGLLTIQNHLYYVPDGDILNIVDPKAMTLRRINLGEDDGGK